MARCNARRSRTADSRRRGPVMRRRLPLIVAVLILAARVAAAPAPTPSPTPEPKPKEEKKKQEEPPVDKGVVEDVVVSASARAEAILDAPAAVSVITGDELTHDPGDQLVDHLRRVPAR